MERPSCRLRGRRPARCRGRQAQGTPPRKQQRPTAPPPPQPRSRPPQHPVKPPRPLSRRAGRARKSPRRRLAFEASPTDSDGEEESPCRRRFDTASPSARVEHRPAPASSSRREASGLQLFQPHAELFGAERCRWRHQRRTLRPWPPGARRTAACATPTFSGGSLVLLLLPSGLVGARASCRALSRSASRLPQAFRRRTPARTCRHFSSPQASVLACAGQARCQPGLELADAFGLVGRRRRSAMARLPPAGSSLRA